MRALARWLRSIADALDTDSGGYDAPAARGCGGTAASCYNRSHANFPAGMPHRGPIGSPSGQARAR
jgi:hypothetical protein